jgi:hypothetical protein
MQGEGLWGWHDYRVTSHGDFCISKKLGMDENETPFGDCLRMLTIESGPLTPAFVKRLMPPKLEDQYVQQQLVDGRQHPWDLESNILESNVDRPDKVVQDLETNLALEAGKLVCFRDLDKMVQRNSDVFNLIWQVLLSLNTKENSFHSHRHNPKRAVI